MKRPKPWKLPSCFWPSLRLWRYAVVVALPNLDDCVAERLAIGVENPAAEVRDLADRGRDAVVDEEQIVVGIERQLVGIERPLGLPGGEGRALRRRRLACRGQRRQGRGRGRRRNGKGCRRPSASRSA